MDGKRKMSDDLEPVLVRVENTDGIVTPDIRVYKKEFKIGRGLDNDEIIPNISISRRHCVLKCDDEDVWTITDLSSSCTTVNGVLLEYGVPKTIDVGDVVQFSPSTEFKYAFTLANKDKQESKRLRIDEYVINTLIQQKAFIESQESKRRELENNIEINCKKQMELELELEKLLETECLALDENCDLNEKILTLRRDIEAGNVEKLQLKKLRHILEESLDKEKLKFEMQLNNEKQQIQEALKLNTQEKDKLETDMKDQIELWKVEWKSLLENLIQQKVAQAQLLDEKISLNLKLKKMEETLKKAEELTATNCIAAETPENDVPVIVETVEVKDDTLHLQVLDVIDLTVDSPVRPEVVDCTKENILDKVSNIMDEQLTCSICSELFVKATTLNCTHTFCQHCINAWSKKKRDCPVCRCVIATMNQSLVLDNFIDKMLEDLPAKYKARRKEIIEERKVIEKTRVAKVRPKHKRNKV